MNKGPSNCNLYEVCRLLYHISHCSSSHYLFVVELIIVIVFRNLIYITPSEPTYNSFYFGLLKGLTVL